MAGIVLLALAYVLSQFYRSFLAVLTPLLSVDLGATNDHLSYASGIWFVAFALMQFPVGIALDRYGPRRTSSFLLAICAGGGTLLFAFAQTPWVMIAAMALLGMGSSPILMSALVIFARTFRPSLFAVSASWLMAVGLAGNVIGASPMALAAEFLGWRGVMLCLTGLTLLIALLLFLLVKDPPQVEGTERSGFGGYLEVARIRELWVILPFLLVSGSIANGIRGLWSGPFLFDVHGADPVSIGNVTLFMALAMVAASFIYGPMDAIFGTRKWVVASAGALGVAGCAFLAIHPHASIAEITLACVAAGLSAGGFPVMMAHLRSFMPPHLVSRGVTAMNFVSIGGIGIMQFVSGKVLSLAESPVDPAHSYAVLFGFYAIIVGSALCLYLFSKDAKPGQVAAA